MRVYEVSWEEAEKRNRRHALVKGRTERDARRKADEYAAQEEGLAPESAVLAEVVTKEVEGVEIEIRKITAEVYRRHNVILTAIGVYSLNTKDEEAAAIRNAVSKLVTAQPVEQENEDIAVHAVVRFEEIRGQAKPEQTEQGEQRLFTEAGEGAQPEIAKQQGEEHVLFFIPRRAGVHQIKGHLRDHRQRREAYPVAELIARVKKALDQQKAEDREGEPAEVAHQAVERQLMTPEPEEDELLIDF